jgi:putative phosphoribosyl transferase
MRAHFRDRTEAGALLARKLLAYANRSDVLVLALPRGGVPVAFAVAQQLHAPMDVLVVRKLGVPGHEEYAMGAIASGGIRILHMPVISALQIPPEAIEAAAAREQVELERREKAYRAGRPPPIVRGMTVILVDDGIATGSTVRAAARALRQMEARFIVIAAPTAAPTTVRDLRRDADQLVAVITPEDFYGVGQWYVDFAPTTDEEVRDLLAAAARNPQAGGRL